MATTEAIDFEAMFVEAFGEKAPSKGHLLLGIGVILRSRPDAKEIIASIQETQPGFAAALIALGLEGR